MDHPKRPTVGPHALGGLLLALLAKPALAIDPSASLSMPSAGMSASARGAMTTKEPVPPGLAGYRTPDPQLAGLAEAVAGGNKQAPQVSARGAADIRIYRTAAPSVVFIKTCMTADCSQSGVGSGSVISQDGLVLTNHHVIDKGQKIMAAFMSPNGQLDDVVVTRAQVVKVDAEADLALLRLEQVPAAVQPLPLGDMNDVVVGADVHAIGHPRGYSWTYTKGLVSQIRPDYNWPNHRATVIQTQTPINPGNSGGPLLSDEGRIIGVNSFVRTDSSSLNFAVSIADVRAFLSRAENRLPPAAAPQPAQTYQTPPAPQVPTSAPPPQASAPQECKLQVLEKRRDEKDKTVDTLIDSDCDGRVDIIHVLPDDRARAIVLMVDTNRDNKADILIVDENRDGKWDYSLHDKNFDGAWDMMGKHADGGLTPTSLDWYVAKK